MSLPTMRLTAIEKSFPGVRCLDGVDFSVSGGEIHALLGENGAGKSTLIKIMGGALRPDGGEIEYEGQRIAWDSPRQAQRAGIHIIYQELALFPELTVAENIMVGHQPRGRLGLLSRAATQAQARAALDQLGVAIPLHALVGELSVADQQMVEIAKALVGEVRLIVFDEPTAVISGREVEALFGTMRRLRAQGVAIVYISHRLEEIFEIGDRVTVLKDGRLVRTLGIGEVDRDGLIRMMVGRAVQDFYPPKPASPAAGPVVLEVSHLAAGPRVRDASLRLRAGEILGLAGLVGSGRTELAHAIFGTAAIEAGTLQVAGRPSENPTPSRSIRAGLGFLTEDRKGEGLFLNLSIAANVTAPALAALSSRRLVERAEERAVADEVLKSYAVAAPSANVRVGTLSGGNQQKVLFGRWARIAEQVLILDEPTRGVDVGAKAEIYRIIRRLAEAGTGILLISSELPEVIGLCDRVVVMAAGRTTGELAGAELSEENLMRLATHYGAAEGREALS